MIRVVTVLAESLSPFVNGKFEQKSAHTWTSCQEIFVLGLDCKGENMGGSDKSRAWDEHTQTIIYKIDNEQGHPIELRELYSIFCDHL